MDLRSELDWRARAWLFRAASRLPPSRLLRGAARLYLDAADAENFADLRINGELRLLRERMPSCSVVFDVGAEAGTWSAPAVAANPAIELHAFEPNPGSFARLAAGAWPSSVRLNPFGLSDREGERELFVASGSVFPSRPSPTALARFTTLDAYCAERDISRIDFVKIDVEGLELAVLAGADRMLRAGAIAVVQFEYSAFTALARVQLRDFFDRLVPLGYRLYRVHPRGLQACAAWEPRWENYRYKNFVAVAGR